MNKQNNTQNSLIGAPASSLFFWVVKSTAQIATISIIEFDIPPKEDKRSTLYPSEKKLIQKARSLRNKIGLPFWDALMIVVSSSHIVPKGLLKAVQYHQAHPREKITLSRQDVLNGALKNFCYPDNDNRPYAILSEVQLINGIKAHIPFLDFRCPPGSHCLSIIREIGFSLVPGDIAILESGESYHLVGKKLLSFEKWVSFLGHSLLFTPIVDRPYIAHQLIEGVGALRISTSTKYSFPPKVVEVHEIKH